MPNDQDGQPNIPFLFPILLLLPLPTHHEGRARARGAVFVLMTHCDPHSAPPGHWWGSAMDERKGLSPGEYAISESLQALTASSGLNCIGKEWEIALNTKNH